MLCARAPGKGAVLVAAVLATAAFHGSLNAAGLTESARLKAVYDLILRARFDQARAELARTCPPAPQESCLTLAAAILWWEIRLDPNNRRLDRSIQDASAKAIDAAGRWTKREPRRAEAWFYLAGAHAPLEEWRILRGQKLAAVRDAVGLKNALDKSLSLDPTVQDAYLGLGLYHYYAAVAPTALKMLRWLLFMPGGDRDEGLREMQRARDQGALLGAEADFQMHWLYLWYEHQPQRALELVRGLDARFPSNPIFLQRVAEIERDYLKDHAASARSWQTLLDRAAARQVEAPEMTAVRARVGLARELIDTAAPSRAIDLLRATAETHPAAPYGAEAIVNFTLGRAHDAVNDRDRAATAWRNAIAAAPSDDPDNIRSRARAELARIRR